MNLETAKKLNSLNNNFYEVIGKYFNHSREYAWEGWDKMVRHGEFGRFVAKELPSTLLTPSSKEGQGILNVLELGCGNGRFLEFLLLQKNIILEKYTGLDASDFLLDRADERLKALDSTNAEFIKTDLLFDSWQDKLTLSDDKRFNLITAFGLFHHIPSFEFRLKLFTQIHSLLARDGLFIFTTWQFKDVPRLSRRVVDLQSVAGQEVISKFEIDIGNFEENDYILDWHKGFVAHRFSHYYTKPEVEKLCSSSSFEIVDTFEADGKEGNVNRYYIIQKKQN